MQIVSVCMKYQILFTGKNKKNVINLSSAELAQRVVKVKGQSKSVADNILIFIIQFFFFSFFFLEKIRLGILCELSASR